MKSNLNNSSIIFDIGANAGFFSIFLTENINPKEIHCFEPLPNNFKLLEKKLRAGNNSQCKFILNNKAVVKPGINSIDLHYDEDSEFSPTASIIKGFDVTNKSICVRAVNIETYCEENRIEKIDFIKMDCEGAEYDIFYNLSASFFEKTSHIYMETHDLDNLKNNTRSLDEFFNQSGFTTQVSSINDHTAMLWAEKQDSSLKSLNTAAHPC
jgi:FkbM family methyltransferase